MANEVHYPKLDIENVGPGPFLDDKEIFLASSAISLKRIADAMWGAGDAPGFLGLFEEYTNRR